MKIFNKTIVLAFLILFSSCGAETKPKKSESEKVNIPEKETKEKRAVPIKSTPIKAKVKEVKPASREISETVNLSSINYGLIESRLFQKINVERKRLGLSLFKNNNNLRTAAEIHNNYMVKTNILDHNESGTSTPTMRDRVTKAGGKFNTAGENIQYEGFTIRTTNGVESIIAPTYEELAEQLWQNWRTSPPHYKNITNPAFIYLGTALKWDDDLTAVFATQVYGG